VRERRGREAHVGSKRGVCFTIVLYAGIGGWLLRLARLVREPRKLLLGVGKGTPFTSRAAMPL